MWGIAPHDFINLPFPRIHLAETHATPLIEIFKSREIPFSRNNYTVKIVLKSFTITTILLNFYHFNPPVKHNKHELFWSRLRGELHRVNKSNGEKYIITDAIDYNRFTFGEHSKKKLIILLISVPLVLKA